MNIYKSGEIRGYLKMNAVFVFITVVCFSVLSCSATSSINGAPLGKHVAYYNFMPGNGNVSGPLKINRIEINFSNNNGDITVPMNASLQAYAVISFDGSGLFSGVWQVDDRALENVVISVSAGRVLSLRMKPLTIIPTFEPGLHRLTLKVIAPATDYEIPTINYFVTNKKAAIK